MIIFNPAANPKKESDKGLINDQLDKVTFQLKWFHQFQFAGYYAAIEKGFYSEEGLEVELRQRIAKTSHINDVLQGRAQYGTADAGLLWHRLQGNPVVLVAQIFQHSPLVFATLKDSGILTAEDLAGKRLMFDTIDFGNAPLIALLLDTQQLMLELSPPAMDEIGLSSAISEWLELQIGNRHSLKTEFIDNVTENRRKALDPNVRDILFRNVRELLVNVVKHARANKVSVRLEDRNTRIRIIVEDDGIGFDPRAVTQVDIKKGGFGLFGIQELMADLGGDLKIVSEPGKGCTAILSAPIGDSDNRKRE